MQGKNYWHVTALTQCVESGMANIFISVSKDIKNNRFISGDKLSMTGHDATNIAHILPWQSLPSPVNPSLQVHSKDPGISLHVALT